MLVRDRGKRQVFFWSNSRRAGTFLSQSILQCLSFWPFIILTENILFVLMSMNLPSWRYIKTYMHRFKVPHTAFNLITEKGYSAVLYCNKHLQ